MSPMIFSLLLLLTFKVIFWKKIPTDQMLDKQCDEIIYKGDFFDFSATADSATTVFLQFALYSKGQIISK